jgi:predicted ATP-dependent serine protease
VSKPTPPNYGNRCENCGVIVVDASELCPSCGAFTAFLPFAQLPVVQNLALDAADIDEGTSRQIPTGFEPWDEALSGGLVLGSSVVLYGDPGCRKSTWAGAIADAVASARRGRALFICPEMPSAQVRDAIVRIRKPRALSIIGAERNASQLDQCLDEVLRLRPRVVVYDSIQSFDAGAMAGSELAIMTTVKLARRFAAQYGHVAILISQVNKAGLPAGPYRTIHDCDMVARVEIGKVIVRKNRYGQTPREAVLP